MWQQRFDWDGEVLPQTGAKCSVGYASSSSAANIMLGTSLWEEVILSSVDNNVEAIVMQNQEKLRESSGKRMQVSSVSADEKGCISDHVVNSLLAELVGSAASGRFTPQLGSIVQECFDDDLFSSSVLTTLHHFKKPSGDADADTQCAVDPALEKTLPASVGAHVAGFGAVGGPKPVSASEQLMRDDASDNAMLASLVPKHLLDFGLPVQSATAFATEEDELGVDLSKVKVGGCETGAAGRAAMGTNSADIVSISSQATAGDYSAGSTSDAILESEEYDSIVENLLGVLDERAPLAGGPEPGAEGTVGAVSTMYNYAVTSKLPDAEYEVLRPKMAMRFPFELDEFQKQAVMRLERRESVFVGAHTSAGKTVVAEYAIAMAKKHMSRTIYTSPIKALSNQKYRDFKDKFDDVGLITGDVSINPDASCLIMTTEILRSMLYRGADIIRDIEWVIFDEVHYVNDLERGVVWEEVIIMLPDRINMVFLSATTPNILEFSDWIGRTKKRKVYVTGTLKRPVPLQHFLLHADEVYPLMTADGTFQAQALSNAAKREKEKMKPKPVSAEAAKASSERQMEKAANAAVAMGKKGPIKGAPPRGPAGPAKATGAMSTKLSDPNGTKAQWISLLKILRAGGRESSGGLGTVDFGLGYSKGHNSRAAREEKERMQLSTKKYESLPEHIRASMTKKEYEEVHVRGDDDEEECAEGLLPVIIFSFSKKKCDEIADYLKGQNLLTAREKGIVGGVISQALKRLNPVDARLPQVTRLKEMLLRGIAVHTSGYLPLLRETVEILFSKSLAKCLIATETFAMGVNFPARAVVFSGYRKHDGRGFRDLTPGEYIQMAGRAGRRGLDPVGTVILAAWSDIPAEANVKTLLKGTATKLSSQFRLTYGMMLNLLRANDLSVEDMIKRSFSEFHTQYALSKNNWGTKLRDYVNLLNKLEVHYRLEREAAGVVGPYQLVEDAMLSANSCQSLTSKIVDSYLLNEPPGSTPKKSAVVDYISASMLNQGRLLLVHMWQLSCPSVAIVISDVHYFNPDDDVACDLSTSSYGSSDIGVGVRGGVGGMSSLASMKASMTTVSGVGGAKGPDTGAGASASKLFVWVCIAVPKGSKIEVKEAVEVAAPEPVAGQSNMSMLGGKGLTPLGARGGIGGLGGFASKSSVELPKERVLKEQLHHGVGGALSYWVVRVPLTAVVAITALTVSCKQQTLSCSSSVTNATSATITSESVGAMKKQFAVGNVHPKPEEVQDLFKCAFCAYYPGYSSLTALDCPLEKFLNDVTAFLLDSGVGIVIGDGKGFKCQNAGDILVLLENLKAEVASLASVIGAVCSAEGVAPSCMADYYPQAFLLEKLKRKIDLLKFSISNENLALFPDFQQKLNILRVLGYVDHFNTQRAAVVEQADNESSAAASVTAAAVGTDVVTLKGRIACEMNTCDELIATEMIFNNVLEPLNPPEVVAVLAALVFQEKAAANDATPLTPRMEKAKEEMFEIYHRIADLQAKFGDFANSDALADGGSSSGNKTGLNFGLSAVVYEWARGTPFKDITQMTNVYEGSIVRTITRLDELCRDFRNAARVVGNPSLYRKMEAASVCIKRDIVFAASLYIS